MKGILQDLASKDLFKRRDSLQSLRSLARIHSSALPLPHLSTLVTHLAECLYDPDREVSQLTLEVVTELLDKAAEDLQLDKSNLLAGLLYKTTDPRFWSPALTAILSYAKYSRSPTAVLSELHFQGLCHEDYRIREKTVTLLLPVVKVFPGLAFNEEEMRETLLHLAETLNDSYGIVADAAAEQLKEWRTAVPVFSEALSRLPHRLRLLCESRLQGDAEKQPALQENFPREETKRLQTDALRTFSDSFTNGLDFGFLPSRVAVRLRDKENWKDRISALSEAEGLLKSLESLSVLGPYLHEFVALLCDLAQDRNIKISTTGLSLLEHLVGCAEVRRSEELLDVVKVCVQKLGDNKITIRQATFRCLRKVLAVVRLGRVMEILAEGLKSSNWHIREELLNVLLTCMLTPDQVHDVDFLELIPQISPLIDDEKPKVRYVAQETLAVLSHICGKERVIAELTPLLDSFALGSLVEKFNRKSVPIVHETFIEFPREAPASAPIVSHHSPIPSAVQTPSHTDNPAFVFPEASITEGNPISIEGEKKPIRLPKRRLKSATKRADFPLFPPDTDSQPTTSPSRESEQSKDPSTRASSLNPLRITRKRTIKRPTFRERTAELIESAYEHSLPAPRTKDLTPLRSTKAKESMRTPVKALAVEADPPADAPVYVRLEDLQPVENPGQDFPRMLKGLQSSEWMEEFEALTLCRALMKYSSDLFKAVSFHEVVFQVLMLADSLRSSLSKNAIITLGEMCSFLPRSLEPDLDSVTALLLRKAVDTNIFLSEAALKSISFLCQSCQEGKIVSSLLANLSGARSSLVKAKSAYCFEKVFQRMDTKVGKLRELDRVLKKLAEFSTEASPEVRSSAKSALKTLAGCFVGVGDIDKLLFRCLSTEEYKQVKAFMTSQGATTRMGRSTRLRMHASNLDPIAAKQLRGSSQPPLTVAEDLAERLQCLQTQIEDSNWQTRAQAVSQACELILSSKDFRKSGKLLIAAETVTRGLSDKNVNVVFRATDAAKSLVLSDVKDSLIAYSHLFVQGFVASLASGNAGVRSAGRDALAAMVKSWDAGVIIAPIIAAICSATDKGRVSLYQAVIDLTPRLYQKRPSLLHKHVLPAVKSLLEEHKPELRSLCYRLVKALYDLLGTELIDNMSQEQMPRLMEVLNDS